MVADSVSPSVQALWTPSDERRASSQLQHYADWLKRHCGVAADDYQALWQFSVSKPAVFWKSLWSYFELGSAPTETLVPGKGVFGAKWFVGTELNYAQRLVEGPLGKRELDDEAVVICSESSRTSLTRGQLAEAVARCRAGLRKLGVKRGERVVAYLPNGQEALIGLLATASLGAIWSSCPPESGTPSVLDRFQQLEPTVLLAQEQYQYGGKWFDRREAVAALQAGLPSLKALVVVGSESTSGIVSPWAQLLAHKPEPGFEQVGFEHPLWILFSSGTTGLPKPIVHGHGGMLVEHLKMLSLHHDLGPGDRFFWFSTTGWMMWNYLVSGLAVGATIVLYDGSPAHPDLMALWRLAERERINCFGVSAAYLMACRAAALQPSKQLDLSSLRSIGSTGGPLPKEGFEWVYQSVAQDVLLASASGGTDLCTAFVGPCPWRPVVSGQLQCLSLGASVEAWDPDGQSLVGEVGELVLTVPMPCMPLFFWNDSSGTRYRDSYFQHYPDIWRHGDWIEISASGSAVISGRSDATLNRGGVRMGTSDFYRVVEELPWVVDSLVVDASGGKGSSRGAAVAEGKLWLFLVLEQGGPLAETHRDELRRTLRTRLSPRHLPDEIVVLEQVPRTSSGKKLEVPVKRALQGENPSKLINLGALSNPEAWFGLLRAAGLSEEIRPA